MRLTKSTVVGAAIGLVAGMVLAPTLAQAAPGSSTVGLEALATNLGTRTAGTFLDEATGKLVVNVTDAGAAKSVEAAGGIARKVANSGARLQQVTDHLAANARIPGTAYGVDPVSNAVVLSYDETVSADQLARVTAGLKQFGSAVKTEKLPGKLEPTNSGGNAIYTGGSRCSLGFNVRSGSTYYFLTAGHCTNIGLTWTNGSGTVLGNRTGSSFPGNDYGIVRYNAGVAHPGDVNNYNGTYQDITSAANPSVNQNVTRSGSTTGRKTGRVTQTGSTVTYPQGTVTGLIRTTVCAQGGDSGGSLYQGTVAYGLTSGGSGNCTTGGTTFFQPVLEPMGVYGVQIY